jgi:hypothetical protein
MLQLPGDHFVAIELVHDPARGKAGPGTGISQLVIQVESLDATLADLAAEGIAAGPPGLPGGADGPGCECSTSPCTPGTLPGPSAPANRSTPT